MSKSEFARMQGWRPSYVTQLIAEGRIVLDDDGKRVMLDESLAKIKATGSGSHQHVADRFAEQRAQQGTQAEQAPAAPAAHDGGRITVRKARELIAREQKLIELGLLKRELLEKAPVNHHWHDLGVSVRAGLEAMIERLAPRIAAAADAEQIAREIRRALWQERRKLDRELVGSLRQARAQR